MTTTEILSADASGIARAAALLRAGGLVAFPTETVYGLGADATNDQAVAQVFEAKNRPRFNPLIAHVASLDEARALGVFNATAMALADAFWPGALTLVVPLRESFPLSELVTDGANSVALRVPGSDIAQRLLVEFGGPVAAPSANPSGRVSPTTAAHVLAGLDGRIAAVLDGGPAEVGLESTIIACLDTPTLLRPGGLPVEIIEQAIGGALASPAQSAEKLLAPGMLRSHYAPGASLRLNANAPDEGEVWLGFGPETAHSDLNLSPAGDLREAAANLFAYLRQIDPGEDGRIAVSPIPEHGLGRAIADRLRRAAAPRD